MGGFDSGLNGRDRIVARKSKSLSSTKAQYIASAKSGESMVTSAVNDEIKVRFYGDAAVVTGR